MGERIGNWGSNCTTIVVQNYDTWYVQYNWSRKNIVECSNALNKISSQVDTFVGDINTLKNYMQNSDFDQKNAELTSSLTQAVANVKTNFGTLTDLLIDRLDNAAKTDAWFGNKAGDAANYIRQYIK